MPIYNMSVLKLPNDTIDQIDRLFRKFWWGKQEDERKMHPTKWEDICKSISEGGLGIRDS